MISNIVLGKRVAALIIALPVLLLQGCVATQDWVREQLTPTESRVGKLEGQLEQMTTRMSATENRLTSAEGRISQVDAKVDEVSIKADKALNNFGVGHRRFQHDPPITLWPTTNPST